MNDAVVPEERRQLAQQLSEAFTRGEISPEEYSRRSEIVWTSTSPDELIGARLPAQQLPVPVQQEWPLVQDSFNAEGQVRRAAEGDRESKFDVVLSVMGGADRSGNWPVPRSQLSVTLMGGNTLDLRDAIFADHDVTITCIAIMGGVEIIVPPEMDVQVNGVGIMGGFGGDNLSTTVPTDTSLPRVSVTGLALMGGVEVKRLPRGVRVPD